MRSVFNPDGRLNDAFSVDTAAARELHDRLLAEKPADASHNAEICSFCVADAAQSKSTVPEPSHPRGGPDVSETKTVPTTQEGGTPEPMSDTANISQETHDALLAKAVADATAATEKALEAKTNELAEANTKIAGLEKENGEQKTEISRINGELDSAQVSLKAANEKVEGLEKAATEQEAAAAKAKVATERAEQVKKLGLFEDDYISEKASGWADIADADWASRLEEWAKLKPVKTGEGSTTTSDAASAMTGTSGDLTKETTDEAASDKPTPRRAALGLV